MKRRSSLHILLFTVNLAVTAALFVLLNRPHDSIPPPGKFFDPFGGFWRNAEGSAPVKTSRVQLKGLQGEVTVNFDDRMVPHIFAGNLHDLYFMQGYVSALHRLWQMDMQTRAAAGRLAEVAGEKALPLDLLARRLGLPEAARLSAGFMMADPVSRPILEAYTAGVNARIQEMEPADLPFEFKLLNYAPEPWSPYKTALLLKYMANLLTGFEQDLENTNTLARYGPTVFNALFPVFPDTLFDPVIPAGTTFSAPAFRPNPPAINPSPAAPTALLTPLPEKPAADLGSNNWAISGSRTINGKPILCNDPHLALNLPSIWFEMQLSSPQMTVYGASIPGAPCIISGFNDSIAWGITNAAMDVKDWYKMNFRDQTRKEYRYDSAWRKSRITVEKYTIKGKAPLFDTLVYTHLGPVTYDAKYHKGKGTENLALRWTAHEPGNELRTFFELNKAKNHYDYSAALNYFNCPGQNFVFASASGDIAIRQQGLFINRYRDQGRFVMDGTTSATAWQGYIPDTANPAVKNPPRGWVSSANQHPADSTWPYHYHGIYEFYRNRRINQRLAALAKVSAEDMMQLQNDNFNLYAHESLPLLLKHLDQNKLNRDEQLALGFLLKWDYYNDPGKFAPIIYETWWKYFTALLWAEFDQKKVPLLRPGTFQTIRFLQEKHLPEFNSPAFAPVKKDLHAICSASFRNALSEIKKWQQEHPGVPAGWAYFKDTEIQHLSRQKAFSVEHVFTGGNSGIVNACSQRNGPSWRMIVSPGAGGFAYGIYPGGQSGNPGSRYYDNFIADWSKGKYYRLKMLPNSDREKRMLCLLKAYGK